MVVVGASILVAGENTTHLAGVVLGVYVYVYGYGCFQRNGLGYIVVADRMTQPITPSLALAMTVTSAIIAPRSHRLSHNFN